MERAEAEKRISEIDAMFEGATGWGSWMVEAANERKALANRFGFCAEVPSAYRLWRAHRLTSQRTPVCR